MNAETDITETLRQAFPAHPGDMSEGEMLTRAREAYVATHRPSRWIVRRIRAGYCDKRLRAIMAALRDLHRPMALIVAERDEATCALILRTTPGLQGLPVEAQRAVADALATAVRMGRRG
jgi:hypothetical protein